MLDKLLDLIFGNIVFVIAIVGGLIAFFKDLNKKSEKAEPQKQQPKTQQTRTQRQGRSLTNPESARLERTDREKRQPVRPSSKQMANAKKSEVHRPVPKKDVLAEHAKQLQSEQHTAMQKQHVAGQTMKRPTQQHRSMKRRLSHGNLTESVVMAEILGSPRALKPHQSGHLNRRS